MPGPRRRPGRPVRLSGQHQVLGNPEVMRELGALREAVLTAEAANSEQVIAELKATRKRISSLGKSQE